MKYRNYERATQDASFFAARENQSYCVTSRYDAIKDETWFVVFPFNPDTYNARESYLVFTPNGNVSTL